MIEHEVKIESGRSNGSLIDEFVVRINAAQSSNEVAAIIEEIAEEPSLYIYAQFLDLEPVKALLGTEYEKHNNLLKLFAYGTYQTYVNEKTCVPQLSDKMIEHLRMLSIVSLGEKKQIILHETLKTELALINVRELEALIIETIACNFIKGIIDQEKRCLEVFETVARDVRREDFPNYVNTLRDWFQKSVHILGTIEKEISQANKLAEDSLTAQNELQEKIEIAKTKDASSSNSTFNYFFDPRKRDDKSKRALGNKLGRGFRTSKSNKKD